MKVALNLLTSSVDPAINKEGDIYFNVLSKNLRIHNGTEWVELTPPSTDPTPFYRHTHTFDGDVHTIDMQNPITFLEYNEIASPAVVLPQVIGMDSGSPSDYNENATWKTLSLFDGGDPMTGKIEPNDIIMDGGNSTEVAGDIVDGGSSLE